MRCPNLNELPPAPPGKTGWPWTEESSQLPEKMADGRSWPRITVVTPSYNQGHFLEETLRSVLLQGYPNLEYIVVDGGSKDDSVEIIKKYEKWLSFWVSEKDRGQSHAINKGLERSTGDILAYLNSDDCYTRDSFTTVAEAFVPNRFQLLFGDIYIFTGYDWSNGTVRRRDGIGKREMFFEGASLAQPSCFWTRHLIDKVGLFDEKLYYTMDYDITVRLVTAGAEPVYIPHVLAAERRHSEQKSDVQNKKAIYYERAHVQLAAAHRLGMTKLGFVARAFLSRRVRRPFPWNRWRELTFLEKVLLSVVRGKNHEKESNA